MKTTDLPNESFTQRLNKAMTIRDVTQKDLVDATGITKARISQYVNGTYQAKQDGVYLLAKALNVNEAWLMGYDCPMERCGPDRRGKNPNEPDPATAALLKLFDELNDEGQKVLLDYAGFLAAKSEYRKTPRALKNA